MQIICTKLNIDINGFGNSNYRLLHFLGLSAVRYVCLPFPLQFTCRLCVCCTLFPHNELATLILLLAFLHRKQKYTVNVNIRTQIQCRTINSCHGLTFPWYFSLSKYTMRIYILFDMCLSVHRHYMCRRKN
jgi:hypothetical protein